MDILIGLLAVLFVVLGLLTRKYPKLIAGYNTMSPERQRQVDVKGLSAFMCRSFIVTGLFLVLVYYLLLRSGLEKQVAFLVTIILVSMLGALYILIGAQRYDHGWHL